MTPRGTSSRPASQPSTVPPPFISPPSSGPRSRRNHFGRKTFLSFSPSLTPSWTMSRRPARSTPPSSHSTRDERLSPPLYPSSPPPRQLAYLSPLSHQLLTLTAHACQFVGSALLITTLPHGVGQCLDTAQQSIGLSEREFEVLPVKVRLKFTFH